MSMHPVGPNPSVYVRAATEGDVTFLTDVVLVAARAQGRVDRDFDEQGWRAAFAEQTRREVNGEVEHSTTYVIEIDGERAGRLRLVRAPGHREIAGIQLLPAHQGHGLGTYLIEQFLVDAHDRGAPARASVQRDNPQARRLYARLGFVEIGADDDEVRLEWRGSTTPPEQHR